jgi:VanZ family protein
MASLDEWHQSFLPNRTSSPTDVLIDCCGATMLILITYLWLRFLRPDRLESVA